jgi:hypothetical protein
MKVGILTFYEGINHGAYLQAYCLYKAILELDVEAEFVSYKPKKLWISEYRYLLSKSPEKLAKNIIKLIKFRIDQKKMNLSKLQLDVNKVDSSKYDLVVVGSDIVWDFKMKLLGSDPIYFGEGLKCKRIASYAPSFGTVNEGDPIPSYVKEGLERFSKISVRDHNSARIVEKCTGQMPKVVLDPTFLVDLSEEVVKPTFSGYILIYAFALRDCEIEMVKDFCKKNELKSIAVGYSHPWCDHNLISVGIFEWLGYFKYADFVVTSTFHGTLYSLHFNKEFCVSMNEAVRSKIESILGDVGLINRVIEKNNSVANIFEGEKIGYESVNDVIGQKRQDCIKFLRDVVEGK